MPRTHIKPRKMKHPFDDSIPRYWFAGNPLASHMVNGVNLLFPFGERLFIRSVKHYLDDIRDDPDLLARVRAFFGQEGHHAREHERWFEVLEAQGYEIREFLDRFERSLTRVVAAMPPALRLSVTAASEHFTAIMAEAALGEGFIEKTAHPTLAALLMWHAAEEIEHKSVAYDVLQKVAPSYAVRMLGLAIATALLFVWWRAGTGMLLRQDGIDRRALRAQRRAIRAHHHKVVARADGEPNLLRDVFWRGIREYLRRDFHPDQRDNYHLAEAYLAKRAASAAA